MANIEKAKKHFIKFLERRMEEFIMDAKEFQVWPKGGYPHFYKDSDVISAQQNLAYNLQESYADIEDIADDTILGKWEGLRSLSQKHRQVCIEAANKIKQYQVEDELLPHPLAKIYNNIQETIDELSHVLDIANSDANTGSSDEYYKSKLTKDFNADADYKHNPFGEARFDIAVITAIHIEYLHVIKLLKEPKEVHKKDGTKASYTVGKFIEEGKEFRVVVACANQMGMTAAGIVALNLSYKLTPRIVVMTGICAGIGSNIGDILVPEFLWDYGSGKRDTPEDTHLYKKKILKKNQKSKKHKNKKKSNRFKPYRYTAQISPSFIGRMTELQHQKKYLGDIVSTYNNNLWSAVPKSIAIHVGPFSSGAAVVANTAILNEIKSQDGKLIGFDMEAYAVAYACQNCDIQPRPIPLIFKSVSDAGDEAKGHEDKEHHQDFAAFTSANFMYKVIMYELDTFLNANSYKKVEQE